MAAVQVYAIGNPFGLDHTLTQVRHLAHMCMLIALIVICCQCSSGILLCTGSHMYCEALALWLSRMPGLAIADLARA